MRVQLINHTPNPQGTIVRAIRCCYQSMDGQDDASDERLLRHIAKNDESPLEFADFMFSIEGISRACSHQLVRHRIASWAQKSQRYCSEEGFKYVIPPAIEGNIAALQEYRYLMGEARDVYKRLTEAFGVKKEDARFVLPNACETSLICKFNARSLRHFFKLRLGKRAQWEIRNVAEDMCMLVSEVAPLLFEGFTVLLDYPGSDKLGDSESWTDMDELKRKRGRL